MTNADQKFPPRPRFAPVAATSAFLDGTTLASHRCRAAPGWYWYGCCYGDIIELADRWHRGIQPPTEDLVSSTTGVGATSRDVGLLLLLDELPLAIGVLDQRGNGIYANRVAKLFLQVPAGSGRPCADLVQLVIRLRHDRRHWNGVVLEPGPEGMLWRGRVWALCDAQRSVGFVFSREAARKTRIAAVAAQLQLQPPEARLALEVADGLSNRAIAERFAIPIGTVCTRLWRLYRKVQVRNRAELVARVLRILYASGVELSAECNRRTL